MTTTMVKESLFSSFDTDLHLERVAGGNETEVYRTDDGRFAVKVKHEVDPDTTDAFYAAKMLRSVAQAFAAAVGPAHSLPNHFLIGQDNAGQPQVVVFQPYLHHAQPLFAVDYRTLSAAERAQVAHQLRQLIKRALSFYRQTGAMPDLYGRTSRSKAERRRLNKPWMLPWRLWQFLARRSLLRGHNLMLIREPETRLVLVDYDPVRRSQLYKQVYYTARRLLFWRDYLLIYLMEKTGYAPQA